MKQANSRALMSPPGEFLSPSGPQLAQPYRVVPAPTFLWLRLRAGNCLAQTFASLESLWEGPGKASCAPKLGTGPSGGE